MVGEPSLLRAPHGASLRRLTSLAASRDIVEASQDDGAFVISENQPTAPVRRSRMASIKQRFFMHGHIATGSLGTIATILYVAFQMNSGDLGASPSRRSASILVVSTGVFCRT